MLAGTLVGEGWQMMRLIAVALLALLGAPSVAVAQEAHVDAPAARQAIESVLDLDSGRGVARLPQVTIDPTSGDLTVVFAMQHLDAFWMPDFTNLNAVGSPAR